jgi:hypothetical protein
VIGVVTPEWNRSQRVMPALVAGIHAFFTVKQVVDGRNKSGHDGRVSMKNSIAIDINADMGESFGRWVLGNDPP